MLTRTILVARGTDLWTLYSLYFVGDFLSRVTKSTTLRPQATGILSSETNMTDMCTISGEKYTTTNNCDTDFWLWQEAQIYEHLTQLHFLGDFLSRVKKNTTLRPQATGILSSETTICTISNEIYNYNNKQCWHYSCGRRHRSINTSFIVFNGWFLEHICIFVKICGCKCFFFLTLLIKYREWKAVFLFFGQDVLFFMS